MASRLRRRVRRLVRRRFQTSAARLRLSKVVTSSAGEPSPRESRATASVMGSDTPTV